MLFAPLLLIASASQASLRCPDGIADEGDRLAQVRGKCGEPASIDVIGYTTRHLGNRTEEVEVQEWVYGPRDGGMTYFLRFEGGKLVRISSRRG